MPRFLSRTPPFIVGALFVTAFMASPSAAGEDKRQGDTADVAVAADVDAGNAVIDTVDTVILPD